jgi:hypothetical protein
MKQIITGFANGFLTRGNIEKLIAEKIGKFGAKAVKLLFKWIFKFVDRLRTCTPTLVHPWLPHDVSDGIVESESCGLKPSFSNGKAHFNLLLEENEQLIPSRDLFDAIKKKFKISKE